MNIIKNIKGTKDIYGDEAYVWQFVESKIHQFMKNRELKLIEDLLLKFIRENKLQLN